ncbi:hypothetical protein THAOC_24925 [Thalassiosira oceanica]|uniref:Uncharacterized protein n=1 Tax=Thalassiosira oceanica TaxID=159749 RepID=K0RQJ1_THAOC|nr:hypothetical protein THAOC_24925 [Thalassiosira oceanica]|eukprot:EJK55350.1 hypothetical protein THAOC_24925 [Thalassiosira oceanica]
MHGLPPRQVLLRGLSEGASQAAQEGLQATCSRAQGRNAVQSGAGEAGEEFLSDLHSANSARVAKKDPTAIHFLGKKYFFGGLGLQKNVQKAVELYAEAAELGSIDALFDLGNAYYEGNGVQQDKAKAAQFWTKAAIQGHVHALENIKNYFLGGIATKDQYAEALKGYQDAVEEMKSHDRDEAKAILEPTKSG